MRRGINDYDEMIINSPALAERVRKILNAGGSVQLPSWLTANPFTEAEADAIYARCVASGCLWQDIPEVAERVKKWEEECQKLKDEGALF